MVKIRFARHGRKSRPFYHLIAADSRFQRDGRFIEKLGKYDPNPNPSYFKADIERIQHWYALGAQLSDPVAVLLKKHKVALSRNKHNKQ